MGPSGPTEPPPPMASVAETTVAAAGPGAMAPSERREDHSTPATPCPVRVPPSRDMIGPIMSPEMTGATTRNHLPSPDRAPTLGPREAV